MRSGQQEDRDILRHDRNFAQEKDGGEGLEWVDAWDSRLAFFGLGWEAESRSDRNFRRIPDARTGPLSQALKDLSFCPAGVSIGFRTNSARLSVRLEIWSLDFMPHMPLTGSAGAELYLREEGQWHPVGTVVPDPKACLVERKVLQNLPRREREYRLYLPLYKGVRRLEVGLEPGATLRPGDAPKRGRIAFYGTSITQGDAPTPPGAGMWRLWAGRWIARPSTSGFPAAEKGSRR